MRKAFNRFCYKYEKYAIRNLMTYVAGGYLITFFAMLIDPRVYSVLCFDFASVLRGQVWRLVTFLLLPPTESVIFILLACLFCVYIGRSLEHAWGAMKTNCFYFSGALLTIIVGAITGVPLDNAFLSSSLLLAFATVFPDTVIRIYFVIPLKVKYLGFLEAALLLGAAAYFHSLYSLVPLIALGNYLLYFTPELLAIVKRAPLRHSKRSAHFRTEVYRAKNKPTSRHQCAECGLTEKDDPNMEFRYCSLCKGYPCYCSQHLFTHEHKQ